MTYDWFGSGEELVFVVADRPKSAAGFEAFVVPEARAQVIPPNT